MTLDSLPLSAPKTTLIRLTCGKIMKSMVSLLKNMVKSWMMSADRQHFTQLPSERQQAPIVPKQRHHLRNVAPHSCESKPM